MTRRPENNDPLDLAAQEEAERASEEATRLKRQLEVDDLKWLMGHRQGKRFMYRLLASCGNFRSSLDSDTVMMAAKEGARNIGLEYVADITECCPERYIEMLKERKEDARRTAGERTG